MRGYYLTSKEKELKKVHIKKPNVPTKKTLMQHIKTNLDIWDFILLILIVGSFFYKLNQGGIEAILDMFTGIILGSALSIFLIKKIFDKARK